MMRKTNRKGYGRIVGRHCAPVKEKSGIGGAVKVAFCSVIILTGIIIKFGFEGGSVHQNLWQAVHGSLDYKEAAEIVGKAVSGEEDVISVFKSFFDAPVQQVYADAEMDDLTEVEKESEQSAQQETECDEEYKQLNFLEEQKEIEKLSFEMSEAELSDDTKAEPFVIPPPSNCSYDKVQLDFKYSVPVYGKITSPYGYRDHPVGGSAGFHTGIDIAAAMGTVVKAFASGTVLQAGSNEIYGNFVLLEHKDGIRSFYGHNFKLFVKKGQNVKLGQKIAEVGSTGLSTGPHLHFEVRKGNLRLNPKYYISPENI